jgi:serine/threonine protein kinase/predicted Zn-dependent protease
MVAFALWQRGDRRSEGIAMSGCPSREQLARLLAQQTSAIDGFEIGAHARSCPICRELLQAMSQKGTVVFGPGTSDDGETVGQSSDLSVDAPGTMADSAQTVDRINSNSVVPDTIDDSSRSSAILRELRGPVPEETIESSSFAPTPMVETGIFAPAGRSHSALDIFADSQEATAADWDRSPDATEGGTDGGDTWALKNLPAFLSKATTGGKSEPADYEILGELGRGGMGIVHKARHRGLNRLVALKMIRGAIADEIQIARFKLEAEAVATLRHPNILQIYDIGEFNGYPYVALELLEGGSLSEKLFGTTLAPRQAAEWMVPLVMAMDVAHQAGIVHRDLKSANILFTTDGVPKITDFGLAKRLESDDGQTHTGQVMGTPSYMAPEQARGDTKSAGPPADIYALGAILYEMLTGRPPFKGSSAIETVRQVIEQDPVSPSRVQFRVPRDLETICMKCLQKEPGKRYATAKDMADDLNRYLRGMPIRARRTPLFERALKWARRHPTFAALSAIGALMVVSSIGAGWWYLDHKRNVERLAAQSEAVLLKESADDLLRAQEAMSNHNLSQAEVILTARKKILERENRRGLESLYSRTNQMLGEVEMAVDGDRAKKADQLAKDEVQKRYRLFLDHRKQALFRDTKLTGLMLDSNLALTRKSAEDALSVFGHRRAGDDWELGELPATLSQEQRAEVTEGCYELLLILAEAVATQDPGQVEGALRILDSAKRLRPGQTRAFHLRRAACLARKNDRAAEARELALAEGVRPETALDYFLSGQQQYKRNRFADAIEDFEVAVRKNADHFWAKCLLAICYIQTRRFEAAKSCLNDCVQTDPGFAWLYLLRGFASGQLGASYLKMVTDNPGLEASVFISADFDFEFDEAEADFHTAMQRLNRTPDDELHYVLLVNRGLIRYQRERFAEAAVDYQEAIQLKKDPFLAHAELGHVYHKQGKTAEAIEQFSRAIAVKPDFPPLYRGRAELEQGLGVSTPAQRARAADDLKLAIRNEKPDNPVLAQDHTNLGKLFYADERFEDTLGECKLALQALPDYPEAHVLKIQALLKLRLFDEVVRSCDIALAKGRKSPLLYELRGLAQAAHEDYAGAIRDYGRALEIRPDDGRLLIHRGWAYLLFESPKPALVDFEAAIKLDPASSDGFSGRGLARARLGDYRAAVADALEALRYDRVSPRVTYNSARIYATAALVAATEITENARASRLLSSNYQDIALQLVQEAFEKEVPEKRAAFWRDTVQFDPALKSIRRRLKSEELIAPNKKPGS